MKQLRKQLILALATLLLCGWSVSQCFADSGPDSVILDVLVKHYEPVTFDHASHVDFAEGNCSECHHHTTGSTPTDPKCARCHSGGEEGDSMACQECHASDRFDAEYLKSIASSPYLYHIDKPGLKGAYHQNCMGCHKKMDGPTGCQDCHTRNDKGDEFFHSGAYSPAPVASNSGH